MQAPKPHPREAERLAALRALGILDSPPEPRFDAITRSATRLFQVPTALISLVDANRQWFKSRVGLEAPETSRDISFCGHAILRDEGLVVEDATADPRFADNPLVTGPLGLRFYAGYPLKSPDGLPWGTLCLLDYQPRTFDAAQREALKDLALIAESELRVEAALRAEQRLDAVLTSLGEGLVFQNREGNIISCNAAAERILGLTQDQMLGRTSHDPRWKALRQDGTPWSGDTHPATVAIATGQPQMGQIMGVHKADGELSWVLVNAQPLRSTRGEVEGCVVSFLDITDLRISESARSHSEARYQAIAQNAPGVVYQFQTWPDGRVGFPFISEGIRTLYGITPEDWRRNPAWALEAIHPEDRSSYETAFSEAVQHMGTFSWQGRSHTARAGEEIWIHCQSRPSPQSDGSILWDGVLTDITQLKAQEANLARQSAFQESLLRAAQVAIISTTLDGVITSFNHHAEQLLGWSASELIGLKTPSLWHDPEEVVERSRSLSLELGRPVEPGFEVFVALARAGEVEQREWTFISKQGERIPVQLAVSAIRDLQNHLVGFLGVAVDQRGLKAHEAALSTSEQRFRALVSSVPGVVFQSRVLADGRQTFTFVSDYARVLLGLDPAATDGMDWIGEFVEPEDQPSLMHTLASAQTDRVSADWVGRLRRRTDGQIRWVRVQASPARLPDGSPVWNGLVLDLTDRMETEKALRDSEERWSLALEANNDGIWDWDTTTNTMWYSPRYLSMLGYQVGELANTLAAWRSLCHIEDLPHMQNQVQAYMDGRSPVFQSVFRMRHKNGSWRWILSRGVGRKDLNGQYVRLVGSHSDITQQREAETALIESESRNRLFLENTTDILARHDLAGVFTFLTPSVETILGRKVADYVGHTPESFVHPSDWPLLHQAHVQLLQGAPSVLIRFRALHASGRVVWLESQGNAIRDPESGDVVETIFSSRDITARVEMEEALKESQARSQALVEAMPDLIFLIRSDGALLEIHAHNEEGLRRPKSELLGKSIHDIMPKEMADQRLALIRRVLSSGQMETYESQVEALGGMQDHESRVVPCGPDTVLLIARDITERKALERLKSDFISTVSHELRTPITSIRGALGLLQAGVGGALPPQGTDLLELARNNTERLLRLVNDILDFEKAQTGHLTLDMQRHDLADLISQAIAASGPFATSLQVDFLWTPPSKPARAIVDAVRFQQVMANLLSNAAKYSPSHQNVRVRLKRELHHWRVEVENLGPPIPEAFRDRIFERFAMADASDTRIRGGTGLGLAISRALVERMGGSIGFTSDSTLTCFYLLFPIPEALHEPQ
jgi:PAS domain S-box-containing protein